jgi:hypothetical protein
VDPSQSTMSRSLPPKHGYRRSTFLTPCLPSMDTMGQPFPTPAYHACQPFLTPCLPCTGVYYRPFPSFTLSCQINSDTWRTRKADTKNVTLPEIFGDVTWLRRSSSLPEKNYSKYLIWRKHNAVFFPCGICSTWLILQNVVKFELPYEKFPLQYIV